MKDALTRMLTSMKFWTTIVALACTAGATTLAKFGVDASPSTQFQVALVVSGLFGVLLHAQGKADAGKEAAWIAVNAVNDNAAAPATTPAIETSAA